MSYTACLRSWSDVFVRYVKRPAGAAQGLAGVLLGLILLAASGGCGGMAPLRPTIAKEPGLEEMSVEVNLVGVSEMEFRKWNTYPMSQYWSPGDPVRESAVESGQAHVIHLPATRQSGYAVHREDAEAWNQTLARWESGEKAYMFVLADLAGFEDSVGQADPRRLILPLQSKRWKTFDITIEVQGGGIGVDPEPKFRK